MSAEERSRSTAPRPCAHCGQEFRPSWPKTLYCSFACRLKAKETRPRRRKRPAPPEEKQGGLR